MNDPSTMTDRFRAEHLREQYPGLFDVVEVS